MKEIAALTLKLLLICTVIAALLAFINSVTAPVIAINEQNNLQLSLAEVLPESANFDSVDIASYSSEEDGVNILSVYKGENGGYAVNAVCSEGYGGDIEVMVGITDDFTVCNVKIISMSETPGLGARASSSDFLKQYIGSSKGLEVIKGTEIQHNRISALSGATITSKAVTKAVNAALTIAEKAGGSN